MPSGRAKTLAPSYRWDMAARVLLAFVGGFLWISALGSLLATGADRVGWMPLAQGVHLMTLLSYALWCALAMWIFYQRRLAWVAALMTITGLLFYGLHRVM